MTDPTTNPLSWLTVTLPEGISKILADAYLTNAIDLVESPVDALVKLGIPLGLVMQIQRAARAMVGIPAASPAPAVSHAMTTPIAVDPVASVPHAPIPPIAPIAPVAPVSQGFYLREPPASVKIREQLQELAQGNMEARAELGTLGVNYVVVDGNTNLPLIDKTMAMRTQFPDGGIPDDMFWDDSPVAALQDVGIINLRWPKDPSKVLMAGKSATGVKWSDVGIEGLIRARVLYKQGLAGDESERTIFTDIQTNGELSQKAQNRLSQDPQLRLECEQEVAPRRRRSTPATGRVRRGGESAPGTGSNNLRGGDGKILSVDATGPFQHLLTQIFTERAMREFADNVNAGALPGPNSERTELAFAIAKGLGQTGKLAGALEYLRQIKPDHSSAISRVSRELGL